MDTGPTCTNSTALPEVEVETRMLGDAEKEEEEGDSWNIEDVEPVDFENNGILWLPPEPENEEDESNLLSDNDGAERPKLPSNSGTFGLATSEKNPDHQGISFSLSIRCVWKTTICERDHLFHIKSNGSFDMDLGQFLRDHLLNQDYRCHSCQMPSEAHVHCYAHQEGTLTISVRKLQEFFALPGEYKGKIWMWHQCLRCPKTNGFPPTTKRVLMQDAGSGLPFGKFLEISFSSNAAASNVASCGHSIQGDCLRFYGFGSMLACLRHTPTDVYSFYLPPEKIVSNYDKLEWIQREADEVHNRAELLFAEVSKVLHQICSIQQIPELEVLVQQEKEEFEELLRQVLNGEVDDGQPAVDILKINELRRQLIYHSYVWDQRLLHFTSSTFQSISSSRSKQEEKPLHPESEQWAKSEEKVQATENLAYVLDSSWTGDCQLASIAREGKAVMCSDSFPQPDSRILGYTYNPSSISSLRELLLHPRRGRLLLHNASADSVVTVYDDEPTSIIAYALILAQTQDRTEEQEDILKSSMPLEPDISSPFSLYEDLLANTTPLHETVSISDNGPPGNVKYTVTCYFAERFKALRKSCGLNELDFARSLSCSENWVAEGGKSSKTLDGRFIIKQVTKQDLESFLNFAPAYFHYLSESLSTRTPTCLAKILGIYQVTQKHLNRGKELRMEVLVMENLFFNRNITKLYDLKGYSRSRYNPDSSGSNKVLLDLNLIKASQTSPIFVGTKAKQVLQRAVWNDTSFLSSIDATDYSLLVGVDYEKRELVVGIINFMRQYTWDKQLVALVKKSLCMNPTEIAPALYKKRFRKAICTYFPSIPAE